MKAFRFFVATLLSAFLFSVVWADNLNTPVGYWKQVSDKTGQVHSIIKIWQSNNQLVGRVVRAFKQNGELPKEYCTKCTGEFRGKKILNINIIWGMGYNKNAGRWEGGRILDPDSGNIYKANMMLMDGGQKLKVRGYIGISLFGRSQTWLRIPPSQVKAELAKGYPQPGQQH